MLWNSVAYLISTEKITDDIGDIIETETEKMVYVNKGSVGRTEYYQALSAGLKLKLLLEVRAIDYSDEEMLRFNGIDYNVVKTYSKNDEIIELTCEEVI